MEIIDEIEPHRRGPYAGAVGYVDFNGNMDTCIALCTLVVQNGKAYVQAGAGIVADSVPAAEYQETLNKARGLLKAVEITEARRQQSRPAAKRAGKSGGARSPAAARAGAPHCVNRRCASKCRTGGRQFPEFGRVSMIYVVATIQLATGRREDFLTLQCDLLPLVRAEAGCVEYVPSIDVALRDPPKTPLREDVVMMHEKWESLDALRAHLSAPHMLAFREKVKTLVVGTKVEVFESV